MPLVLIVSAFLAISVPAGDAAALTQAEKKACYEQWAGGYTGTAGDKKKLTDQQFNNFKNRSDCNLERDGSCRLTQYAEGASIKCQRADGQYDFGEGWGGTEGGDDGGNTGDDGTDSGSNPVNTIAGEGCGGVKTAVIKCDATNESKDVSDNGIWALLIMTLNIMTAGVGILAVGGIVYGSILYATAEDKADQVKKAQGIITNVVIGLILFAFMWAGLNFIVPGGVFA